MQWLPVSVFPSIKTKRHLLTKPLQISFRNLTYYEILGVKTNATPTEIKAAYVNCSKKLHPDVNKNDPKANRKFAEVNEAYTVLSKSHSKLSYDATLNQYKEFWHNVPRHRTENKHWTVADVYYHEYYKSNKRRRLFFRKDFLLFIAPLGTMGLIMVMFIQYLNHKRINSNKNLQAKLQEDHQKAFAKVMLEREKIKKENS